ncbi:hypothetical protein [Qaidamihabitans albus]|uniref:hypothetical protein n=1 Tax=Qaidamihabitans albus TaxID=2795733 RepID=UPI0018F246E0|nr:hypothetical protein [Qaidamihabitans albus]
MAERFGAGPEAGPEVVAGGQVHAGSGWPAARTGASLLAVTGALFLLYPVLRPYSDESTLAGARAMSGPGWLVSHLLAVAGFVLLALSLLALYRLLQGGPGERQALRAVAATWTGAGLTLPYYGAEVFGLHAISLRALREQDPALLELAETMRMGPVPAAMFAAGLALLAGGTVLAALAVGRSAALPRGSGAVLAVAFVLFLPQFFTAPPVRMAHGALVALGCGRLAVALWRSARR